jgi:hypothetical protein
MQSVGVGGSISLAVADRGTARALRGSKALHPCCLTPAFLPVWLKRRASKCILPSGCTRLPETITEHLDVTFHAWLEKAVRRDLFQLERGWHWLKKMKLLGAIACPLGDITLLKQATDMVHHLVGGKGKCENVMSSGVP